MSKVNLDFLPISPKSQSIIIIGSSQTFSDESGDISNRSCLIDALNYEKISNSVFQVGTLFAYDYNLERFDTFYNFHLWAINLDKLQLVDFAIPRLESLGQELNFDFGVPSEKMKYTILPYSDRQKAWECLDGDGDHKPNYFGEANLIYVPGALPSTISVVPSILVISLLTMTKNIGYIHNLNFTVDKLQQLLDPYGKTSNIFSVFTFKEDLG